jgi:hypothetical protein
MGASSRRHPVVLDLRGDEPFEGPVFCLRAIKKLASSGILPNRQGWPENDGRWAVAEELPKHQLRSFA